MTSTVLRFAYRDTVLNLLDTPGHKDFSEDTLRVLAAADCAVMLLDAAKGVEAQTLRLFEVARARNIPLITFVNKYDRPGIDPLEMLDHIERVLGLTAVAATWPVGIPGDLRGVIDRTTGDYWRFTRTARGATRAPEELLPSPEAHAREGDAWTIATEELELLDGAGERLDPEQFATGRATPVFFGSAVSNFGVGLLLEALLHRAPAPQARRTISGEQRPVDAPFSALVFKVQANMDPRHRDGVAFLRVCSGRFERGMRAINQRSGRPFALTHAHTVFGDERTVVDEAFPGDVVGVINAADLRVGDTLYLDEPVQYPAIPTLAPEHFVTVRNADAARHKQFHRGLVQLAEEGVVHLLRRDPIADPTPVLAGIGPLQFDVDGAEILRPNRHADILYRSDGSLMALFTSDFMLDRFQRLHPDVTLERMLTR